MIYTLSFLPELEEDVMDGYGFDEGIHFVPKTINCGGTRDSLLRSGETSVMEIERRVRVDVQFYKISTAWQALPADSFIKDQSAIQIIGGRCSTLLTFR